MSESVDTSQSVKLDKAEFILAEYSSLRDEYLKRLEFQNQIINLTLILAGTFISLGSELNNPNLSLIYPILSFFLAVGWVQNNLRIRLIGIYIQEKIETSVPGYGWENYRIDLTRQQKASAYIIYVRGIFFVTQMTAIAIAAPNLASSAVEIGLLFADVILMAFTLLWVRRLPRM